MKIHSNFIEQEQESVYKSFIRSSMSRRCHKESNEIYKLSALELANSPGIEVGVEIPTIDAVGWSKALNGVDIRPKLVDRSTGVARLIDSGAMISAAAKGPNDKLSEGVRLVAVNGSRINTYGMRNLTFKMGRKTYTVPAVVCDIAQDILGMDFIDKYKLNMEWDDYDQSELFLVDKRAQIKERLKVVTVPTNMQRAHHIEQLDSPEGDDSLSSSELAAAMLFEVACMKELGGSNNSKKLSTEEALKLHAPEYVEIIKAHPALLKPT